MLSIIILVELHLNLPAFVFLADLIFLTIQILRFTLIKQISLVQKNIGLRLSEFYIFVIV
jgi:hypothetical protein